jgi:hypothetical protein
MDWRGSWSWPAFVDSPRMDAEGVQKGVDVAKGRALA